MMYELLNHNDTKNGDIMFYKHLIVEKENVSQLYLFVDFNYEFASSFKGKNKKERNQTLKEKIIQYIKEKNINFEMGKVFLVVGGLVIGSLFIQNYKYEDLTNSINPKFSYVEQIDIFGNNKNKEDIFTPPVQEEKKDESITITKPVEKPAASSPIVKKPPPQVEAPITESNTKPAPKPVEEATPKPAPTPTQEQAPKPVEESPPPPTTPAETTITLYRYNGTIQELTLEEYVIGVVGGEMPASFNIEALKAQSVLARTYALKKLDQNQILKDDVSHQVYKDQNQLKQLWGSSFDTYYNKIKNAVTSTKGQYLSYNNNYIEAVYHSTSNGKTEDAVAVWGNSFPYLKSVDSHWDLTASSYLRETTKEFNILSDIIGLDFNSQTNIEVLSRTVGNRIDKIKIDDTVFTGIELRSLLGLRSADFDINVGDTNATFVTRGFGHGVGMSQYGANGMAKEGYSYQKILSHYYPSTQLKTEA